MLVDTNWQGQPRKLLLQANRNGFFYVLDRTNGQLLLAKPFLKKLNWAKGIGKDGRPVLNESEGAGRTARAYVCPGISGRHELVSRRRSIRAPACITFRRWSAAITFRSATWNGRRARVTWAGAARPAPGETFVEVAARDQYSDRRDRLGTAAGRGTVPDGSAGVISTASGLVFFGENSGSFMAADAANGKVLWEFPTNQVWKASPMTYMFDNKQYVAIASGLNIIAFALPE